MRVSSTSEEDNETLVTFVDDCSDVVDTASSIMLVDDVCLINGNPVSIFLLSEQCFLGVDGGLFLFWVGGSVAVLFVSL